MSKPPIEPILDRYLSEQQLPPYYRELVIRYLVPLSQQLADSQRVSTAPYVLGVNGAQGTGKSTICLFIKLLLETLHDKRCVVLSIDDFYLSRAARQQLATEQHPLFRTRGVPGTHDVDLALTTIRALLAGQPMALPQFDKATDDVVPAKLWLQQETPVDVILLEGWCVGALPQPASELLTAVNGLEADEDSDHRWRVAVNQHLGGEYQQLFAQLDSLLMLKAPDMAAIYQWRLLQEQKLAAKVAGQSASGLMDAGQIQRFIQHYERLTRYMLAEMPARADVVITLNAGHQVEAVSGITTQAALS